MQIYRSKRSFWTFQHTFEVEFNICICITVTILHLQLTKLIKLRKTKSSRSLFEFKHTQTYANTKCFILQILCMEKIYIRFQRPENCLYHWRLLLNKYTNSKFLIYDNIPNWLKELKPLLRLQIIEWLYGESDI